MLLCAFALSAADDPFIGTWKLNVAKSKFDPGPPTKSTTVAIAADGKVTVSEESAKGEKLEWSYTMSPGAASKITGLPDPNATVTETRKGNVIDHAWKIGTGAMKGRGTLSKDGKTMTYNIQGTDPDGKKFKNAEIYDRQ